MAENARFRGVGALVRKHLCPKLFPNSSRLLQMCQRFLATILIRLRGRDSRTHTATCVLERIHLLTGIRAASSSPQISDKVLKRFLSIFSDLILDSSVDRGMPNLAAAPVGPNTRPRLAFRASSMMFFSCSSSLRGSSIWFLGFAVRNGCGCCGNQLSSIEKVSVSQRITERSMTFCSSRMFPGQAYD